MGFEQLPDDVLAYMLWLESTDNGTLRALFSCTRDLCSRRFAIVTKIAERRHPGRQWAEFLERHADYRPLRAVWFMEAPVEALQAFEVAKVMYTKPLVQLGCIRGKKKDEELYIHVKNMHCRITVCAYDMHMSQRFPETFELCCNLTALLAACGITLTDGVDKKVWHRLFDFELPLRAECMEWLLFQVLRAFQLRFDRIETFEWKVL
jgi:hypothetical protein